MCTRYSYPVACRTATELGATIQKGHADWTIATGFPSAEVAWYFQTLFNGMESVGAFPAEKGYSVKFR